MTGRVVAIHHPLPFTRKGYLGDYFFRAFNASYLNQTGQTIHHYDVLTFYYTTV